MMKLNIRSMATAAMLVIPIATAPAKPKAPPAEPPRALAIEMGAPFQDQAILQREMKIPVWGWSEPGTAVTVEFAGQKKSSTTAADGKWTLELDPLAASSESREMTITDSAGKQEVLKHILVGEVWMCSGQSNMQWLAADCDVGQKLIPEILERVKAGGEKLPLIREVKVTDKFSSLHPSYRVKGKWSTEWDGFSAVAFAFAYDIARETGLPVGIVNCAFSTTTIQAWTPREGFAAGKDEYTKAIYRKILEGDHSTPEHQAAWTRFEQDIEAWGLDSKTRVEKGLKPKPFPQVPGNLVTNRDPTWMCNGKITPMAPYAIRGAIWNQGYASQDEGIVYRNNLHSLIRGWRTLWNNPDLPVYFHQFYGVKAGDALSFNACAEMRLGTWLASKDIHNTGMASQIDITGAVHYRAKTVPGQRLARHALKNQYGKMLVADGPTYRNYKVVGDKLVLEFHSARGLCVGQNMTIEQGYGNPVPVEKGEAQVKLFYLADKDLAWHRATVKITGEAIELTAPGLKEPRGVAYANDGVGGQVGIYNEAMLPLTPFILYDHKLVISRQWAPSHIAIPGHENSPELFQWPMDYLKIAGQTIDPTTYGLQEEHRKLWLLSPQFAHNCVIQAGVPTRLYGKAIPKSVVTVKFAGFEKSLTMGEEDEEWEVTVPAMKASAEPKLLHVTCTLDGKLAHERKITNVVVGDVWYVAANDLKTLPGPGLPLEGPAPAEAWKGHNPQLRMLAAFGQRQAPMPSRFKLNSSGYYMSDLFARWTPTTGLTKELAERIHAKTGKPVGIVVLDVRGATIKEWTGYEDLTGVEEWKADHAELAPHYTPDPDSYVKNSQDYLQQWREFWKQVQDPQFETGNLVAYPVIPAPATKATTVYNQSICAFSPGNFKAILCIPGKGFVAEDEGARFGEQVSVMANSWKSTFARGKETIDPHFVLALPAKELAAKLTPPTGIKGKSSGVPMPAWPVITIKRVGEKDESTVDGTLIELLGAAVKQVYP